MCSRAPRGAPLACLARAAVSLVPRFFGGRERVGFGMYVNFADVWAFDLATDTWTEVTTTGTGPSPRSSAVAFYDAPRDRLVVFGGNVSTGGLTLTGVGDAFALNLATGEWQEIDTSAGPPPRLYHGGVGMDGSLFIYGGTPNFDGPFYADTWALDLETDAWRQVSDGAGGPASRFGGELFADAERGLVAGKVVSGTRNPGCRGRPARAVEGVGQPLADRRDLDSAMLRSFGGLSIQQWFERFNPSGETLSVPPCCATATNAPVCRCVEALRLLCLRQCRGGGRHPR